MNHIVREGKWEKRWHPLKMQWVVYAAHRNSRPWEYEKSSSQNIPVHYDPGCYLCPGNKRVSGKANPKYNNIFVFDNDHPVVSVNAPEINEDDFHNKLYKKAKAAGISRVVCYHPRHDLNMSSMGADEVLKVFITLQEQTIEFIKDPMIKFILIFENRGELVGVSNPHPHCQIYATDFVFSNIEQELCAASKCREENGKNIFEEIISTEIKDEIRIITENEGAIAFVPFFARYAYEVMIFPKKKHATLATMNANELENMAILFQEVTRRFDMNYRMMFPYVMSVMQAPIDGKKYDDYHMHLLIQPPLRQPGLKKFLAGPEIGGGNFMADTMPEEKAGELRQIDVSKYDPGIIISA